jgi:glucose/arabinose dehydrogenase
MAGTLIVLLSGSVLGCAKLEKMMAGSVGPEPPPAEKASAPRPVNPDDIQVPAGYKVEAAAKGLNFPTDITFSDRGEMFIAESGDHTYGIAPPKVPPARILQVTPDGGTRVVYDNNVPLPAIRQARSSAEMPEGLIGPVTGVTWHQGKLYVSHRSRVSVLDPASGEFRTIINGLPSWGFFHNHKVVFGPDGKMYFSLASQGNAGPIDAHWMAVINAYDKQDVHEIPCEDVTLTGENFPTPVEDPKTGKVNDKRLTGVYVPLGEETEPGQRIKGQIPCNGSILRANADGSNLELVAWGLRDNYHLAFAPDGRLIASQNGGNPIPPREIYGDWDTFWEIRPGTWYGWPDYYSGLPVTEKRFAGTYGEHKFVLDESTRRRLLKGRDRPPQPLLRVEPLHSANLGFTFGQREFGIAPDEMLVAQFGTVVTKLRDELPGFRVVRMNLRTGESTDFMVNKSKKPAYATGGGGLERPIRPVFGPDGALYVLDFGRIAIKPTGMDAQPGTGVLWKVTRQ